MIFGIGTDIVEVGRIASAIERHKERFTSKILHPAEASVTLTAHYVAKRFAAKEAVSKALGTGMRWPVAWQQIIIIHDELGRPAVSAGEALQKWLSERRIKLHLTLADEKSYVVATAVAVNISFFDK